MKACCFIDDLLKEKGLKTTKQRHAIIKILSDAQQPMDVEQIYESIRSEISGCNLSTVYRNMELLYNIGIVHQMAMEQKSYYTFNNGKHTHYLQCLSCKQMIEVSACPFDTFGKEMENNYGFKMMSHRIEMYGLCRTCNEKEHL